jgi:hypothetical protein
LTILAGEIYVEEYICKFLPMVTVGGQKGTRFNSSRECDGDEFAGG